MSTKTDTTIKFEGRTYDVPVGFTVEEFVDSLAATNPKAATAKLIKDGEGVYTLKSEYKEKG
jgi:sulfur carrier protein ThiS